MDEDTYDAACAQQESDERRRREDEALQRLRPVARQFRQESAEFEQHCVDWHRRMSA